MFDSEQMNVLLIRCGPEARAIPGTLARPAFYALFAAILDRIEGLETDMAQLRDELSLPGSPRP